MSRRLVGELGPLVRAGSREEAARADVDLRAEVLAGDPCSNGGRRVLFYSGDDTGAKAEVACLIDGIGFAGIDLGALEAGGELARFPGGASRTRISSQVG